MTLLALLLIIASFGGLLFFACFSAAEAAIFSIKPPTLKLLQKTDSVRAGRIEEILWQPRRFLIALLLGNALSVAIVTVGLTLLCLRFCPPLDPCPWWIPILATMTLLLIAGEMIPKALAFHRAGDVALFLAGPLHSLEKIFRGTVRPLDAIAQRWASRMAPAGHAPLHGLSEEEYITMLDVGMREGALGVGERRLIERALRLADRNLRELMTPRSEICGLDVDLDIAEMRRQAIAFKHRRLPIYSGSPDSVVGILNVRRFLLQPDVDLMECIDPPAFVPETMTALELMKNLIRVSRPMALVVDEFGGVEGLITLENLVEEVFGDIQDEYDAEASPWEQIEPHVYIARGSAHLPDVSLWLEMNLEADGIDTLGGWITDRLGTLPKEGDTVQAGHYTFQVEKMNRSRVASVLVRDERKHP